MWKPVKINKLSFDRVKLCDRCKLAAMEKVRISTKNLLDDMMQQLGLPNAAYST